MNAVAGIPAASSWASSREMRPSAMRCDAARMAGRRARFAGDEIVTDTNGYPLVVGPAVSTWIRSDRSATTVMYSRISSQRASSLSVPIAYPKYCSGDGICWACSGPAAVRTARNNVAIRTER